MMSEAPITRDVFATRFSEESEVRHSHKPRLEFVTVNQITHARKHSLHMTTSKQPGPDIPSEAVTSQPEKQKDDPKQLKKEHLDAKPGPVILTEGQASKIEQPKSKEELQRKAKEMNEG